jgi:hypothetical protein
MGDERSGAFFMAESAHSLHPAGLRRLQEKAKSELLADQTLPDPDCVTSIHPLFTYRDHYNTACNVR